MVQLGVHSSIRTVVQFFQQPEVNYLSINFSGEIVVLETVVNSSLEVGENSSLQVDSPGDWRWYSGPTSSRWRSGRADPDP